MDEKLLTAALGALAQETRLALFRLLLPAAPGGFLPPIAERLGSYLPRLPFTWQQLVHAGLITQRRLSRQLIYSAEYGAMNGARLPHRKLLRAGASCVPACNPAAGARIPGQRPQPPKSEEIR